jgi:DNA ligase (NAD+)
MVKLVNIEKDNIITLKIQELINQIRYYDYMYFIKNTNIISDLEYDLLKQELEDLEQEYPYLIQHNSPTYTIGFQPNFNFQIQKHSLPMLSLKNTYILDDVIKHLNQYNLWPVVIEPKIDGISLSLVYMNSLLSKATLRGNGLEGEDVLDHILYTRIPMKIDLQHIVEIRGELYISQDNFQILNKKKVEKKETIFQNSRNATCGIIRNKNLEYITYIDFIPYSIYGDNKFLWEKQTETLENLEKLGFLKQNYLLITNTNELKEKIISLPFSKMDIDGIVIKTNDLNLMHILGGTNHHPRGSIAYKFTNIHKEAIITNILWQVSRNGKIIPIAIIIPIILNNALIKKITLHNKKYMIYHKINIGSTILIERVGSTVPQIKKVLTPKEEPVNLFFCPGCNKKVIEDQNHFYCINLKCIKQKYEKFYYFCQNLKFKGLGYKNIEILSQYCETYSDILQAIRQKKYIKMNNIENIYNTANKILDRMEALQFLISFGIENMSKQSLLLILDYYKIKFLRDLLLFIENFSSFYITELKIKNIGFEKLESLQNFILQNTSELLKCIQIILQ